MLEIGYLDLDNPIAIVTPYQDPDLRDGPGLVLLDGIDLDLISVQDLESALDELHFSSALGLSVQGETLLMIDKKGNPLRNAIIWLDNRAQKEAEVFERNFRKYIIHE